VVRVFDQAIGLHSRRFVAGLAALVCLAGCQTPRADPSVANPATSPVVQAAAVSPDYAVVFPDILELDVAGRPECSGGRLVYPDGRIDLGPFGMVFAEGATAAELTRRVAEAAGVPAQHVSCRVAAARSRSVFLLGQGAEHPRAVPYSGPERVSDLLRRAAALPVGAEPADVRVVRRNVARGAPTETFRVDLAAIRRGDDRTNVVLEPNDEVHVSSDHGVRVATFLPERTHR
jgi:protein involved in polysaccharide export with SLBB domain